jgi:hypothetical protein
MAPSTNAPARTAGGSLASARGVDPGRHRDSRCRPDVACRRHPALGRLGRARVQHPEHAVALRPHPAYAVELARGGAAEPRATRSDRRPVSLSGRLIALERPKSGYRFAYVRRVACLDTISWGHRWGHATPNGAAADTCDPRNHAVSAQRHSVEWARQDSNLGPTDYESAALTAELRAPPARSVVRPRRKCEALAAAERIMSPLL